MSALPGACRCGKSAREISEWFEEDDAVAMHDDSTMPGPVWEERWHPLREEWIIVAAHRQDRPWAGQTVAIPPVRPPAYVPDCYLCPGNLRVSGARNPDYTGVFVFDNDHPCVGPEAPQHPSPPPPPYANRPATGLAA